MRSKLPIRALFVLEAEDFLGIRETAGPNQGPSVDWFLRAAGLRSGLPWCAAFANRVAEIACAKKNLRSPLEDVPLEGYVQSYYRYGAASDWLTPDGEEPPFGAIALIYHPSKERYAHLAIVSDPHAADGRYLTVEGNSNTTGSREGIEVVANLRFYDEHTVFIDPWRVFDA